MKKTLLQKGEYFLHITPKMYSKDLMLVRFSAPFDQDEYPGVDFPVTPLSSYPDSNGWNKTFPLNDYEVIVLTLGFEQGWDEVDYLPYPIYKKPAQPLANPAAFSLSHIGLDAHLNHHYHNVYHSPLSSYSFAEMYDNHFLETLTQGFYAKKFKLKLLKVSDPPSLKLQGTVNGKTLSVSVDYFNIEDKSTLQKNLLRAKTHLISQLEAIETDEDLYDDAIF